MGEKSEVRGRPEGSDALMGEGEACVMDGPGASNDPGVGGDPVTGNDPGVTNGPRVSDDPGAGGEQGAGGDPPTLDTRLKSFEGRQAAVAGIGKDPVNVSMIRHWCEAMGDSNPAYTAPEAIAPPTMLQVWTMGGLSGHTGRTGAYDELLTLLDEAGCTSVVATDCEQEYGRALRPGDEVTFDSVIESVSERKTTKLGAGYFVTTRMDIRAGEDLVGTHRFRILKYAPARRPEEKPSRPRPAPPRAPALSSTATTPASGTAYGSTGCSSSGVPPARRFVSLGCRAAARVAHRTGTRSRHAAMAPSSHMSSCTIPPSPLSTCPTRWP